MATKQYSLENKPPQQCCQAPLFSVTGGWVSDTLSGYHVLFLRRASRLAKLERFSPSGSGTWSSGPCWDRYVWEGWVLGCAGIHRLRQSELGQITWTLCSVSCPSVSSQIRDRTISSCILGPLCSACLQDFFWLFVQLLFLGEERESWQPIRTQICPGEEALLQGYTVSVEASSTHRILLLANEQRKCALPPGLPRGCYFFPSDILIVPFIPFSAWESLQSAPLLSPPLF